jgi:hypothetical protein
MYSSIVADDKFCSSNLLYIPLLLGEGGAIEGNPSLVDIILDIKYFSVRF